MAHTDMTLDLFADMKHEPPAHEALCEGALLLRRFALPDATAILHAIQLITIAAPYRRMVTRRGFTMSVAMTNCGEYGWLSDRRGYRYDTLDPDSDRPWPAMPEVFARLASVAAKRAGFENFAPDACLINRYEPGARMSLHQDRNERDFSQPIVSVSLGLPAVFLFGGLRREDRTMRVRLTHGDVLVWGGPARTRFHGIAPIKAGQNSPPGNCRINLTLRRAG
jgi:alkylated DNA repair protein (DNA oxidative demethylase)